MVGPRKDEFNQAIQDIQNANINVKIEGDLQHFVVININIRKEGSIHLTQAHLIEKNIRRYQNGGNCGTKINSCIKISIVITVH